MILCWETGQLCCWKIVSVIVACVVQEALEIEPLKVTVQAPPARGLVPVSVDA